MQAGGHLGRGIIGSHDEDARGPNHHVGDDAETDPGPVGLHLNVVQDPICGPRALDGPAMSGRALAWSSFVAVVRAEGRTICGSFLCASVEMC